MRTPLALCLALAASASLACGGELPPAGRTTDLDCPNYWRDFIEDLPADAEYIPGHITVKFLPSVSQDAALASVKGLGLSYDTSLDLLGGFIVCTNPGTEQEWVDWFTHGPLGRFVEYAERGGVMRFPEA